MYMTVQLYIILTDQVLLNQKVWGGKEFAHSRKGAYLRDPILAQSE